MTGPYSMFIDLSPSPQYRRKCVELAAGDRLGFRGAVQRSVPSQIIEWADDVGPWQRMFVPLGYLDTVMKVVLQYFDVDSLLFSPEACAYLELRSKAFKESCREGEYAPRVGERRPEYDVN